MNIHGNANRRKDDGSAGTSAPPEAWAKLASLIYTRDATGEQVQFPTGLAGLLKAISDVLNHCVATGDLAVSVGVVASRICRGCAVYYPPCTAFLAIDLSALSGARLTVARDTLHFPPLP